MTFLLSEQRLKADFLNDNVDSALVLSAIQTAQDIYLRQTLGDSLFETICELVENNSVVEPYKTLLDDYIIVYLEYLAMSELCVTSTFKLGNIGIAQSYDSNVNSQSIQNVKYLESFYKQKASTYENRLVTYIQQNINYFPEYLATNEVVTAKESTLQTGIFLGGTKTKTTKRTTTNKNSLVGVVRYDVQQNLSEQQKQQARENIGVSGDIDINLDNYYTKEETYSKEEVDNLLANNGGGSDTPSNMPIVDIMSLTYEEQVELIDFVFDNNRFPDVNTLYTYQGYVLNNLTFDSDLWGGELNYKYITFNLYSHPKSYEIRFITYQWNEGNIYNDITEKDFNDWLVTNGEINTKLGRLSNGLVLDLYQYDNDELLSVYNRIKEGQTYTDKPITYRGKFINNVTIEGENVRFWHYAITTDSNYINSDKTFYVDVELYDVEMQFVRTIYTEIGDCTVIGGNGGGSDTPSNMPVVDIMSLPYDKQLELIDFVIDNNIFPNINTLYTYQGYVLNNLEHYSAFWNEENGERYIVFSLYDYPKSYDIRFITYQWNEGKIYNDINEKDFNDWLVTNSEINNKLNTLSNGLVLDLFQYDNDELAHVYNKIYYMGEQFTDKPITYRGKFINNITIEGENVRFWHYAITTDSNNINSDKSFYVDVEMYDDIMGLVRTIYTEIGDCTVIGGNGGGTTDLSNYYNKQETDTAIQNAVDGIKTFSGNYNDLTNKPTLFSGSYNDLENKPTLSTVATSGDYNDLENKPTLFDGDYNSLENKPTIPTATSQLQLDNVYNKSEIDLLFESVNTTLGDINNLLETI